MLNPQNRTLNEPASVSQSRQVHENLQQEKLQKIQTIANMHKAGGGPQPTATPDRTPTPPGYRINIPG